MIIEQNCKKVNLTSVLWRGFAGTVELNLIVFFKKVLTSAAICDNILMLPKGNRAGVAE